MMAILATFSWSPGKRSVQLALVAGGDLLQDLPDPGQETLDQALGPALQRLGQDGVVGVGHRLGDDIPGVVPAVPSTSIRIRISSGMTRVGWVSLIWMTA